MRRLLLLVLVLVSRSAAAQNPILFPDYKYDQVCKEPTPAADHLFLNANTGDQIRGKTQFPEGTTVQVVYYKPNPFRYTYSFSHNFLSVDAAQTYDFFKLVPGFGGVLDRVLNLNPTVAAATQCVTPFNIVSSGTASKIDGKVVTAGAQKFSDVKAGDTFTLTTSRTSQKVATVDSVDQLTLADTLVPGDLKFTIQRDAPNDVAGYAKVDNFNMRALDAAKSFIGDRDKIKAPFDAYTMMQLRLFGSQDLECPTILPRVNELLATLHDTVPPISPGVDAHVKTLDALAVEGESLRKEVAATTFVIAQCGDEVKKTIATAMDGDAGVKKTDDNEKSIQTQIVTMLATYDKLREIFTSSNLFYSFDQITEPRAGFETIQISVVPRDNADKNPPKPRNVRLQFGDAESRIRLSAGIGFSNAPDVRIARIPGKDGTQDVQRFGYESNSTFRPSALVMISVLPWDVKHNGLRVATWGPSVGLVLSQRGDGTVTEYVGGLSFGLAGDIAFLTVGLHAARPESFPTGFKEGDVIPTSMGDPLPVQRDWTKAFMASLTFKIR